MSSTTRSGRNIQLDILRGLAILLVFGRHLELPRPQGLLNSAAATWFQIGWLGVDLFFVLSGFLIGGLLVTELKRHGRIDIPRFLIRRGLKIYPPYFVFIGYLILMPVARAYASGASAWAKLSEEFLRYLPNLVFLQNYVEKNPAGHTWSLAVEEHFYLILPFALAALASAGHIRLLVPACLAIVPAVVLGVRVLSVTTADAYSVTMSASHLRLDALLFGVGIRGLAEYSPAVFAAARRWRLELLAVGLACWSINVFVEPGTQLIRTVGLGTNFIGSACILLAVYHTHSADLGALRGLLTPIATVVAWIGFYSYAIYLWHVTVMGIGMRIFGDRILSFLGRGSDVGWLVAATVICAAAVLAGVATAKLVEWPVLRLRDRFFPSRSAALPVERSAAVAEQPAAPSRLDAASLEPNS